MLKSLVLCFSTCFAYNYPVEIFCVLFSVVILNFFVEGSVYSHMLVDNLNSSLITLSFIIICMCLLTNRKLSSNKKYLICNTTLLLFLVASFLSKTLLYFFLLFETSLIPLFFVILGWGYQPERLQSSLYFLFYTLFGSLPLLLALVILSKSQILCWSNKIWFLDIVIYLRVTLAFLIKMPMFLTHLWLPKAHVEAPTIGSMILAGVTLKLGRYALLRLYALTTANTLKINWTWISVSVVGNLLLCIVCLRQRDLKALIAYSSVIHMGLCLLTILFLLKWSYEGGLWLSLSHGLVSSGLFYLTNRTYIRINSRRFYLNKGVSYTFPTLGLWWFLLLIFNMASPPSLNLFSEIKMVVTTVTVSRFLLVLSVVTRFFCATYCLFVFRNIYHGKHSKTFNFSNNLTACEHFVVFYHIWPLILSVLLLYFFQWIK